MIPWSAAAWAPPGSWVGLAAGLHRKMTAELANFRSVSGSTSERLPVAGLPSVARHDGAKRGLDTTGASMEARSSGVREESMARTKVPAASARDIGEPDAMARAGRHGDGEETRARSPSCERTS